MKKPDDLFDLPFEEDEPSHEVVEPPLTSNARQVLTVTDLTVRLRDLIESRFYEVWVQGELSNCRPWNGHLYFTLKDPSSQIRGFMFRSARKYLKFKPADGLRVVARGKISVYEPKGEYQLVCEHLEPQGLGALQLAFEQLKRKLQSEGLFDRTRKRPLPQLPRKVGVVTSLEGAAVRDIVTVLGRGRSIAHVVIRPARVQGEGAAADVARGLRAVCRIPGVEVVIVGRGGGSTEDLWAFNEEVVARAIASAPVPVIAAVGHETDMTIADLVADLRAPTPSAAAAMVVAAQDELIGRIDRGSERLRAAVHERLQVLARRLHAFETRSALTAVPGRIGMRARHAAELTHGLSRAVRRALVTRSRTIAELQRRLDAGHLGRRLAGIRTRIMAADGRLKSALGRSVASAEARLRVSAGRLDALSPLAVLGRGYAVCWKGDRSGVVRDASDVSTGDHVKVTLARGELGCVVHDRSTRTN
jgi:exodeoxyribonuclease VII large subunit